MFSSFVTFPLNHPLIRHLPFFKTTTHSMMRAMILILAAVALCVLPTACESQRPRAIPWGC
jgi:hypothetical protein